MSARATDRPASNNARKPRGRPFEAGNKHGRGRPQGSRNKATLFLEKIMIDDGEAVVRAVIEPAKRGDMQAARMILDRIVPVRRGRPTRLDLPAVETSADVLKAQAAIIEAMSCGDLTPDEAAVATGVIEAKRRAIETEDFEKRIEALEQQAERQEQKECRDGFAARRLAMILAPNVRDGVSHPTGSQFEIVEQFLGPHP